MQQTSARVFGTLLLVGLLLQAGEVQSIRARFGPSLDQQKEVRAATLVVKLAVPRLTSAPHIDGEARDAVWRDAAVVSRFTSNEPDTRARVGFDDRAVYVVVLSENPAGQKAVGQMRPRDFKTWVDDCVHLLVLPKTDGAVHRFIMGCKGAISDTKGTRKDYDPEWHHATGETVTGWVAEAAIPWAALGLDGPVAELGFNVSREGPHVSQRSWGSNFHSATESKLILQGVRAHGASGVPEERRSSPLVSVSGTSLVCEIDRTSARPGERWIRMVLNVKPREEMQQCRLRASLFKPDAAAPVEQRTFVPTHERCVVEVDLRRVELPTARLNMQLIESAEATGVVEAFLSTRSAAHTFAEGDRIPILVDAPEVARSLSGSPITVGVPFGRGQLWSDEGLCVVDDSGEVVPFQRVVTGRWADEGSIQWVRFDALVNPSRSYYVTRRAGAAQPPAPALTLRESGENVIVDTGAARYVLAKGASPIREIRVNGRRIATGNGGRGLYVVDQRNRLAKASVEGESMKVEARGPVASCVRFEGPYRTADGADAARHITRVECFAGRPFAKITHTLILTQDTNEVWFREIGWELQVDPGASARALFGLSQDAAHRVQTVPLQGAAGNAFMIQDSHYRFGHGKNHFHVANVPGGGPPQTVAEGEECGDWAALVGAGGGLMANCLDSAKQHPKEFQVFGNRLILKLFSPRAGEELDFRTATLMKMWDAETWFESVSYRPKYSLAEFKKRLSAYPSNAIGWAKTHDLLLAPLASADGSAAAAARLSTLQSEPILAQVAPAWTYRTQVMGPIHPSAPERFPALEKLATEAFAQYIKRDEEWGHFGFIYYGVGPNMAYSYRRPYAMMRRYQVTTYTYRKGIWRQWVRSQDRTLRRWAEKLTRTEADAAHAHVATNNLSRGMLRRSQWPTLPVYWGARCEMQHGSATDLHRFIWHYQLTGDRRLRDFVEEWADGVKKHWTPSNAKGAWRILMAFRQISQAYSYNFDPDLRDLASATADMFEDPDGELLLTKTRPYHSSTYKTQVDIRGIVDAWHIFGDERYHRMARRIAEFWWPNYLKCPPTGYNVPLAFLASFLYGETGNPAYAQATEHFVRRVAATPVGEYARGCAAMAPLSDAGIALDLITRTGVAEQAAASWFHFSDPVDKATLVVHKEDQAEASFHYISSGRLAFRALNPSDNWGLDTMQDQAIVRASRRGTARLPKDVNECDIEISFSKQGEHALYADGLHRLVLYAPGMWYPAPSEQPPTRYYFQIPADAKEPRIFFEGSARLFRPDGKPHENGRAFGKWVALPTDTPGLWAFEPVENKLVRVDGLPPFFAAGSAASFYVPNIEWKTKPLPDKGEQLSADDVYVPGAIRAANNQGLYLTGKRHLIIEAQGKHPSSDGSLYLPHREATVEFWFKPTWSSAELPDGSRYLVMGRMYPPKGKAAYTQLQYVKEGQVKELYGFTYTDGESGKRSERLHRHDTFFNAGEWVHIALVWGRRDGIEVYPTNRKWDDVFVLYVYVNGRKGKCAEKHMNRKNDPIAPLRQFLIGYFRPERNMDGVIDELRISDVQRYLTDFVPPSRDVELKVDDHTRALFHFNGDLKCETFGEKPRIDVQIKQ